MCIICALTCINGITQKYWFIICKYMTLHVTPQDDLIKLSPILFKDTCV